mmetsp:Transcript_34729/g.121117  ORF Transcript_34729/g.121117 Transcript_34729/m.121117 type:complete len:268 (+) Transcript_34729:145-948(+)
MPNFSYFSGCSTGYCTSSRSSRFTSCRPPMSSHVVLGTSTTVSRSDDGLDTPRAYLKWSCVTAIESSTSASIVSSSMSMRSIFSRMHCMAASVQSAAMSAPTKPCVSRAMDSGSTSSSSFMLRVWMRKISRRPFSSGTPMSISRSKRPKRRSAGSMELGRFVAPMTKTFFFEPTPSISVRIWLMTRSPASEAPPDPDPRALAMASISSKKRMQGADARAFSKSSRTLASDSPNHMVSNSGPLMEIKLAPHSWATAWASKVLPQPGGP